MHNRTLIERWPPFASIFASSHPILNLITIGPAVGIVLLMGWSRLSMDSLFSYALVVGLAWLYWTFFEYGFHRWVYHGKYRPGPFKDFVDSFHIYHHRNIEDPRVITAGPMMIVPLGIVLLVPWYLVFANRLDFFSVMAVSLLLNYYFYEWVHFLIHRSKMNTRYMRFIKDFHGYHHERNWTKNFGNTTSFWDHIWGTYEN